MSHFKCACAQLKTRQVQGRWFPLELCLDYLFEDVQDFFHFVFIFLTLQESWIDKISILRSHSIQLVMGFVFLISFLYQN